MVNVNNAQPTRLVNCCCCGQSGERDEMYFDKIDGRFACVDLDACIRRQDEYARTHRVGETVSEAIDRDVKQGLWNKPTADDDDDPS